MFAEEESILKTLILAGGIGTRLWPLSRERYPKQFIKFMGRKNSLFQDTFERSLKLSNLDEIYIVTNRRYKFLVMGEIEELGYSFDKEHILVEPGRKNTLPAICYGVWEACSTGKESVVVFPSDHVIEGNEEITDIIRAAETLAQTSLVTFGIQPTKPHSGYGYIAPGEKKLQGFKVRAFREKPEAIDAAAYVRDGYLWNSGIFMFRADVFKEEVRRHASSIYEAFESGEDTDGIFSRIETGVSMDYGIMEETDRAVVVPVKIGWNDLGSFDSFYEAFEKDASDNLSMEGSIFLDAKNNLIHTEKGKALALVGVEDLIVVDERDALLICRKGQSQRVKDVVELLGARKDFRTEYATSDYRPWGSYKVLEESKDLYKIKSITVSPGKKLSYQSHRHRSEHWIVVKGEARVTIDDVVKTVPSGESVFVKIGQKHCLENDGKDCLEIIEVQMGNYLGEDDIVRYEDPYGR